MRSRIEVAFVHAGRALAALALAVGALLPGCGGGDGVDSGGTGMTPPTLAVGPVAGYGSIVVGGVHFDERAAAITDEDGRPLDATALTLGAMTQIEGSAIVSNGGRLESTAEKIRVVEQVVGPVEALDVAAATLTVLGQPVVVTPDTAFDSTLAAGLGALHPGDRVAVYGQLDVVRRRLVATRLERRAAGSEFVLRAAVDRYERQQRSLTLGGIAVSLADLPDSTLPDSLPAGTLARVRLRAAPSGPYVATSLRRVDLMLADRDYIEIEGRISALTSTRQFSVDGIPVDASSASLPSDLSRLVAGARVEVEGRAVAGTIIARKVELESEDGSDDQNVEVEGRISALDTGAKTFVVRTSAASVTVSYAGSPRFEGGTAADLALERKVSVKGRLSSDRTRLDATTIKIER